MSSNDNNEQVMDLSNATNQEIAQAYYNRDIELNLGFNEQREWALKKLGYTNEKIISYIKYKFERHIQEISNNFSSNIEINIENGPSISDVLNNNIELSDEMITVINNNLNNINEKKNRMNLLANVDNHLEFYRTMTREELDYLGF